MAYKVRPTKTFLKKVVALNSWLEAEWGNKVAIDFQEKLELIVSIIAQQPGAGSVAKKNETVRKILVTKHNRLYYRISNDTIELLALIDTRQNPKKNKFD
jgi:plasmid stabilization system protein ParE